MNEIEQQILEEYAEKCSIGEKSYELMGKMLDAEFVKERLRMFHISDAFIYGGTYMAAQLYRVAKNYINIPAIVDKAGKMLTNENIKIITLEDLRQCYGGEKIIVTPIQFYSQIKSDLIRFADSENIIFIGELLEGIA
ncbi:MAG: hypothetical protein HFJ07_19775 [Lachnospiraceae bacterium]|nr:hypothetical protein [Lachnospiraceae bacterium]